MIKNHGTVLGPGIFALPARPAAGWCISQNRSRSWSKEMIAGIEHNADCFGMAGRPAFYLLIADPAQSLPYTLRRSQEPPLPFPERCFDIPETSCSKRCFLRPAEASSMYVRLVFRIFGCSDPRFTVCTPYPDWCYGQRKKKRLGRLPVSGCPETEPLGQDEDEPVVLVAPVFIRDIEPGKVDAGVCVEVRRVLFSGEAETSAVTEVPGAGGRVAL